MKSCLPVTRGYIHAAIAGQNWNICNRERAREGEEGRFVGRTETWNVTVTNLPIKGKEQRTYTLCSNM